MRVGDHLHRLSHRPGKLRRVRERLLRRADLRERLVRRLYRRRCAGRMRRDVHEFPGRPVPLRRLRQECPSGICVLGKCLHCPIADSERVRRHVRIFDRRRELRRMRQLCPAGVSCQDGQCAGIVCGPAHQTVRQPVHEPRHRCRNCGGCGTVCWRVVRSGAASLRRGRPTQCGSACTDLTIDSANCGACGNVCPAGSACSGGGCIALGCSGTANQQQLALAPADALTTTAASAIDCPPATQLAAAAADAPISRAAPPVDCGAKTNCGGECADLKTSH